MANNLFDYVLDEKNQIRLVKEIGGLFIVIGLVSLVVQQASKSDFSIYGLLIFGFVFYYVGRIREKEENKG